MYVHFKKLKFIFSCAGFCSEICATILRKVNIILHKINMMEKRLEVLEEQHRVFYDKHERDINILNDEEIGIPLCDELTLETLEAKLQNQEFFDSLVCYFLNSSNLKILKYKF